MAVAHSKVQILHAASHHAKAIVNLQESIYAEDRWFVGDHAPYVGSLERRLRSLQPRVNLYLIATVMDSSGILAWLELNRFQAKRLHHVATLTIAVQQQARRQGIARKLLYEAYLWAKSVGIVKIQLNARANNKAAIALYQSEGFVIEGQEKMQIRTATGFEDNLVMAKFI